MLKARTCSKFRGEGLLPLFAKANAEIKLSSQQVLQRVCCSMLQRVCVAAFREEHAGMKGCSISFCLLYRHIKRDVRTYTYIHIYMYTHRRYSGFEHCQIWHVHMHLCIYIVL